jgi:hypothetical protein
MQLRVSHLRRGEILAAVAALLLGVVLFALPWFGAATGWRALPVVRWLLLVSAVCGLLLAFFQQTRRAPALPVVMSVIVTALALVAVIALIVELATSAGTPRAGAYLGLAAELGILVGGFWSMRDEDGWTPGPDRPVERVSLRSAGEGGTPTMRRDA